MRTEFKNRVFLPIVLPLAIILVVALVVLLFAAILLWNTYEAALVIAITAAAAVLFAIGMAASRDRLAGRQRAAVLFAGLVPIIAGGIFAIPGVAGVDESQLNINVQPHAPAPPDDAPLLAAEDAQTFCLPADGGCEPTDTWEATVPQGVENFAYFFDNRDTATGPHNLALFELAGSEDSPEAGTELFVPEPFAGPQVEGYVVQEPEIPEQFYFMCTVHPNMNGVGTVVRGGEGA